MEFIAEAEDDRGQRARASYSVWPASGEDAWFDAADHDRIDIIPDKTEYQPGERARFQVRMPFRYAPPPGWPSSVAGVGHPGDRAGSPRVRAGHRPDWTPNVYVSVLAVRGRLREVPWYSFLPGAGAARKTGGMPSGMNARTTPRPVRWWICRGRQSSTALPRFAWATAPTA